MFKAYVGSLEGAGAQKEFSSCKELTFSVSLSQIPLFQGLAAARISCLLIASIMLECFIV